MASDCKSSLITLKAFRATISSKSTRKISKSGSSLRQRQVAWILLTKFALTRPKPAVQKRANLDRTAKSVQLVWIAKYAQERVIYLQKIFLQRTGNDLNQDVENARVQAIERVKVAASAITIIRAIFAISAKILTFIWPLQPLKRRNLSVFDAISHARFDCVIKHCLMPLGWLYGRG